jgi:hypothetical protein
MMGATRRTGTAKPSSKERQYNGQNKNKSPQKATEKTVG